MSYYRGIATFGLDYGKCPKWLFERMVKLSREILVAMREEYGPEEIVKRLADPVWFQSLGTVLAFDWNSSGLTTILTAALKEAVKGLEKDLGIFICGGKGKTSRKTPQEILDWSERLSLEEEKARTLVYNSKMVAKVDNSLVQDGYQIYHHTFFFTPRGSWAVVQQGMNTATQMARRYHWYSDNWKFNSPSGSNKLTVEPHQGIVAPDNNLKNKRVLNLVSRKSIPVHSVSVSLVQQNFSSLMKDIKLLDSHFSDLSRMVKIRKNEQQLTLLNLSNKEFAHHPVEKENFLHNRYLWKILYKLNERQPQNYEELLSTYGVGPKTIRALALVAEVIYGAQPSYQDPARYSFAHGGKDATPYPVDRKTYDESIDLLKKAVERSKLSFSEKKKILKKEIFNY